MTDEQIAAIAAERGYNEAGHEARRLRRAAHKIARRCAWAQTEGLFREDWDDEDDEIVRDWK